MIKLISKCVLLSVFALSLSAFSVDGESASDSSTGEQGRMDRESRIEQDTNAKMAEVDANGDGVIDKKEFVVYARRENPDIPADVMDENMDFFFAQFDANGDGVISKVEMALVVARMMGSQDPCLNCE